MLVDEIYEKPKFCGTSKSEIDLSEVKSGIYFLKIQDYTDNFYSKKLIKN